MANKLSIEMNINLIASFLISCELISACTSQPKQANTTPQNQQIVYNIDTVFVNWNKQTYKSLDSLISSSSADTNLVKYLKSQLAALKSFFQIEEPTQLNKSSIRYQFLNKIYSDKDSRGKLIYIVESNRSGEQVIIRNFAVYLQDDQKYNEIRYYYRDSGWEKDSIFKNELKQDEIDRPFVDVKSGVNYDDIIISKFLNDKIVYVHHFPPGGLTSSTGLREMGVGMQ